MIRLPLLLLLSLAGCMLPNRAAAPADAFLARIADLCGRAFEGRVVSPPATGDEAFVGQRLVMHVRDCGQEAVRVPFHVGADRSRTWVLSRTGTGLQLKHDHRHADGTEDRLTQYGGSTAGPGSAMRQEFPADGFSRALFVREGRAQSVDNVWAMEIVPGRVFAYELRRPGRFFRVEFDLTRPVAIPPSAWAVRAGD